MHEAGLLTAAVAAVCDAAGSQPVREVTLALGPGIDRGAAAQAWRIAVAGGPLAGAAVRWESTGDLVQCLTCGEQYAGDAVTACPSCGGDGLVVQPAPELAIVQWRAG